MKNRTIINLEALYHNLVTIDSWMKRREAMWTVVTKVLCGHSETFRALKEFGVNSMGESRLDNLEMIRQVVPNMETWYLRMPNLASIKKVCSLSDVSLNSEIRVIKALNREAALLNKIHRIIIMIELGDLREGILPGSLVKFYEQVFNLPNIEVMGIGANLGCMAGALPSVDQYMQLILYKELLELKFGRKLPMISAASSVSLPLALDDQLPKAINHFRIGEAIFLGSDLINGGILPELRDDTVVLEAEIVEIKEKSLISLAETSSVSLPFPIENTEDLSPGQRGYRALVNVGHLDTDVIGLRPENPNFQIAGASSDVTVVNIGDTPNGLSVGDSVRFRLNYAAMLRLMGGKYIDKVVTPSLEEFKQKHANENDLEILPALDKMPTKLIEV